MRTKVEATPMALKRFSPLRPARRGGFSLIELLIVVAIIAILGALLFPMLARVRAEARSKHCVANLRQIGQGFTLYMNDWEGRYPAALDVSDYLSPNLWMGGHPDIPDAYATITELRKKKWILPTAMKPYLSTERLWECPSDTGAKFLNVSRAPSRGDTEDRSAYEAWGSSYAYRTELGLYDMDATDLREPAKVNVIWDMAGYWHARYQRASRDFDTQDKDRWVYHVLWGDGHVAPATDDELYDAWGVFSSNRNPFNE
jgi:prepilin-type N-terminal cleavage/methylation domain-containing protein